MEKEKISVDRVDELMRLIFLQLVKVGGRGRPKEILAAIEEPARLNEYEKSRTKTGAIRWQTHLRFYTTDCVKAGYITKAAGYWTLTDKGQNALKLEKGELIRSAQRLYRDWRNSQASTDGTADEQVVETEKAERQTVYEQAVEDARAEIDSHIDKLDPYDFQNLVAELLMAMGYHVPWVAPPGRDGGIDLLAYMDPLGTKMPRIKVQVRHRDQKVAAKDVRELEGLLRKEGDVGLIVSSGGFTSEAEREIRSSAKHIETMDLDRLIALWQQHYAKLREPGKVLLPLVQVSFLAPTEE